ncbi:hypothetical protein GCM10011505_24570 [Tistrella bauzanensis]|uniref:Uncharacterized protein n=1 Tax=Tistrella bauzanensis TaxID=657419 RepID=A0ABQ1IJF4_9PROT|nr:hypothetical protein GCM10011505_24570 [Tistrella bauzanensis]
MPLGIPGQAIGRKVEAVRIERRRGRRHGGRCVDGQAWRGHEWIADGTIGKAAGIGADKGWSGRHGALCGSIADHGAEGKRRRAVSEVPKNGHETVAAAPFGLSRTTAPPDAGIGRRSYGMTGGAGRMGMNGWV